jgi:phosphatidylserine/phosphatidylglycerophosphate/cardiolipin synthase-like enzyme
MSEKIRVVVSGDTLLFGGSSLSIDGIIDKMLREAKKEVVFTVYSISDYAKPIVNKIVNCLERGIKVKMIIDNMDADDNKMNRQIINYLKIISQKYPHFELYNFSSIKGNLHAKVLMVDQSKALIGSSNLSYNGMMENHEIAVYIEGEEVSELNSLLNKLIIGKYVKRVNHSNNFPM